jgi:hypothetical protein
LLPVARDFAKCEWPICADREERWRGLDGGRIPTLIGQGIAGAGMPDQPGRMRPHPGFTLAVAPIGRWDPLTVNERVWIDFIRALSTGGVGAPNVRCFPHTNRTAPLPVEIFNTSERPHGTMRTSHAARHSFPQT